AAGLARAPRRPARAPGRRTRRAEPRSSLVGRFGGERRGSGLELAAISEDLDAPLGLLEPGVAEAGELHAALVQRKRLLERQVAFFELFDDAFELRDRPF